MENVAIFVRVSKGMQDYERQIQDLTTYSIKRNYNVVQVITERGNGAKNNSERECIKELLSLVEKKQIVRVLVSEVSRLGRKTSEVLQVVEMLAERKVSLFALNFSIETLNHDGSRNPIAHVMFTMLAEFARLEHENLSQRITSGLAEAKRKGKKIGRPKGSKKSNEQLMKDHPKAVKYLTLGLSIRETAKLAGVSTGTAQKIRQTLQKVTVKRVK